MVTTAMTTITIYNDNDNDYNDYDNIVPTNSGYYLTALILFWGCYQ